MAKRVNGVFSSVAISIAASTVISLPISSSDGNDIAAVAVAALFTALFVTLGFYLIPRLIYRKGGKAVIPKLASLLASAAMAVYIVFTLREFSEFTASEVLPKAPLWAVFFLFFAVAAVLAAGSLSSLRKTAMIFFTVATALTILIFLFSIPKMSFKYIIPSGMPDMSFAIKKGLSIATKVSVPAVIAESVVFGEERQMRGAFYGSIFGSVLLLTFTLNTLLVFGGGFAATLRYPYVSAVSTANMGDIFSGLDGFLYVSVFLFCIFKISILLYGIKTAAKNISSLKK